MSENLMQANYVLMKIASSSLSQSELTPYLGECGKVLVQVFLLGIEQRVVRAFPVRQVPETADVDAHDLRRRDALP